LITLHRKGDGTPFVNLQGQCVFKKEGVNFALTIEQMKEMQAILQKTLEEVKEDGRSI